MRAVGTQTHPQHARDFVLVHVEFSVILVVVAISQLIVLLCHHQTKYFEDILLVEYRRLVLAVTLPGQTPPHVAADCRAGRNVQRRHRVGKKWIIERKAMYIYF